MIEDTLSHSNGVCGEVAQVFQSGEGGRVEAADGGWGHD